MQQAQTRQPIYLKDYTPTPYTIKHVELKFELHPTATTVQSRLTIEARKGGQAGPLLLDGRELRLDAIAIDDTPLSQDQYQISENHLTIPKVPAQFTLTLTTTINPEANLALEGLYISQGIFSTQCEAEGFRRITYFYDRPDIMATYQVTLIADKKNYPVLLSNGNCLEQGELGNNRHYTIWDDPFPKPSYLFALVAGQLASIKEPFTTKSGRTVSLEIYAAPRDIDKCQHAMHSLKNAFRWDEETFDLECDLDQYKVVAISDFNMGAMENKGLNIFNTALILAKPEIATDDSFESIEAVIGHEYFHNWTGNRVTCRDWFQLCLKEGLTVYRDQEFSSDMGSRPVHRIHNVTHLRIGQWPEDDGPMAHPPRPDRYIEINNFYTTTVYYKGAEVVRMLATLLGQETFRKGLALYLRTNDGKAATQEDFVAAMAHVSGRDLSQFMKWYTEAGTPTVTVRENYDARSETYSLHFKQETPATPDQPRKGPRVLPLQMGLIAPNGHELPLQLLGETNAAETNRLFVLSNEEETLTFQRVPQKPLASIFRGFSADVKVKTDYTLDDLKFLMMHDQDPFNCWDAGQNVYLKTIVALVADIQAKRPLHLDKRVCEAFGLLLEQQSFEPAFKSLVLGLPSERLISQHVAPIDVDAIYAARQFMRKELAQAHYDLLQKTYRSLQDQGPFRLTAEAMGRRSLKNRCLAYLQTLGQAADWERVKKQFQDSNNMTDVESALGLIADWEHSERPALLQSFYQKWQHEDLVVDRWFAVQALSRLPHTLSDLQTLSQHPAFHLKNPNRIRALLGNLSMNNAVTFHQKDGAGYKFIREFLVRIDKTNRQMASYLARAFDHWKKYDTHRQKLMRQELEAILHEADLSPDVYEVVSRSCK